MIITKTRPVSAFGKSEIDIELACDADLDTKWQGGESVSPRQKMTLQKALSSKKAEEIRHINGPEGEPSAN